jgi:hypothetical protein
MVYLAVRRDMYMVMGEIDGMRITADGIDKTVYSLSLCADCFYDPRPMDIRLIFSHIQEHYGQDYPEYAEIVSKALRLCLEQGATYLTDRYDSGEVIVLLNELRDTREKRWKGEHLFEKFVLFPVFRDDEDRIV